MSDEGKFFILTVVNTLLCDDFGFAYKIASATESKYVAGRLFKSNITRLRSLCSIKMFQHGLDDGGDIMDNWKLLKEAIKAVTESNESFEANTNTE